MRKVRVFNALAISGKNAVFTKPLLVAEIEYRAWTEDGKLRHPSFKGSQDNATICQIEG
ncbi:hypothetical protein [Pararhizobium sp. LjRoot238]|uniref:ATP dependent DNA ligase n=1 Tax=Pararhizobium sp. LjRoot238 TaxID=3342293 RepID=UPI003F4F420B